MSLTNYTHILLIFDAACHAILQKFVFVLRINVRHRSRKGVVGGDLCIPFYSALKSVIVLTRVSR